MGGKEENKEIHILMVAMASEGHINPMLRLAKRLVSKGIRVTFASNDYARHLMLRSSTTTAANSIAGINLEFFSDGLNLDFDRKTNLDSYMESLGKAGPTNLSAIIQNHSKAIGGPKFSCIINNPFVPWVADVAADHGIPCAMLWIQPCTLYSIYYRFYNNLNTFPTLNNPNMSVKLPGLPLLDTHDLPSFVLPTNTFGSFPKMLSELFLDMKNLKWVFCNSFYELEKDAIDSTADFHPIRPVGPLVPSTLLGEDDDIDKGMEMWKSDDACIDWLDQQSPSSVIYISFGSILVLSAKQMENIAIGLKNSNRPFLWVVKPPEHVAADGGGQLPLGFLEEIKDRGLIVKWSPQVKVLSHPSVACFLTHCGWNSLSESIAAGIPVISYPQWTDQPTNAKLVTDVFQVGVRLLPSQDGVVTSEEVEKCIEQVMVGPKSAEIKKKAAYLKRAAKEAVAEGGSSDQNIQWFIDEISGNK